MRYAVTAEEMQRRDARTMEYFGMPSMVLMERAALAVFHRLCQGDFNLERVLVLGHGAQRLSAVELKWEVEQVHLQIQEFLKQQNL